MVPAADLDRAKDESDEGATTALQQYLLETDWHKLASRKVSVIKRSLMNKEAIFSSVVLGVLLDATEIISEVEEQKNNKQL